MDMEKIIQLCSHGDEESILTLLEKSQGRPIKFARESAGGKSALVRFYEEGDRVAPFITNKY